MFIRHACSRLPAISRTRVSALHKNVKDQRAVVAIGVDRAREFISYSRVAGSGRCGTRWGDRQHPGNVGVREYGK
jgi:hypothetical protein